MGLGFELGLGLGLGLGWRRRWKWRWKWAPTRARAREGSGRVSLRGAGAGGRCGVAGAIERWGAPQHELVEPGGELLPGRLATHGQRFRDLERLGSQLAHGSKLRVRSLQGKRLGAADDLVVDAPCHDAPSRQVELPLLEAGQLVERCAARRQRELAKLERGQERERDLQLLLPVLHLRLDHAVGAVRVLPTALCSHQGGLAHGASIAPPFLLLPDLRRAGGVRGRSGHGARVTGGNGWEGKVWGGGELTVPNTEPSKHAPRMAATEMTESRFSVRATSTTGQTVRMSRQLLVWRREAGRSAGWR